MNPAHAAAIARLTLGTRHEPFEIETSDEVRMACLRLIAQARREVLMMSRHLEPVLFNDDETSDAVRRFVLGSRAARVRMLVKDPAPAVRDAHRLIDLAQRLSTFVEIRVLSQEFREYNAAFVVADGLGAVHRTLSDRYEATVSFADERFAGELTREFTSMWESAARDPSLRRLHL